MYKKDAIKKAREINPEYQYLTDIQVLDALKQAIPDIKLEDEPFGYSVTKPVDDLGIDLLKGADNFIGDASSTVIGVGKKFGAFENIDEKNLTTPGEILGLRGDKYKFGESGILGRTAKKGAEFVDFGNESAEAYNKGEQGFGETAFQIGGKGVGTVSETVGDAFMSGIKTVAPTETEEYVKEVTSDFVKENEYAQGAMEMLQEYQTRKKWLKENSPEDYRNLEASVGAISGLVDMLGFGAGKKAVEGATSAQVKEMTKQLMTKLDDGLKKSGDMIKNIKGSVVNGVKRTGKTIDNLGDNGDVFPAITDSGVKFEIAKPNIAYRINDKLFGDDLLDLAQQAVKPRINVKKGTKGMLRNGDEVLGSIKSLYDDFADGIINSDIQSMKGGIEGLMEAKEHWGKIIGDLPEGQVNHLDIQEDILKALYKLEGDELLQIDDMFGQVSKTMNIFAKGGGKISLKRIQEKLSSIKGDIFSNAETVKKLTSTESGRVLGEFLENVTKKLDDAIAEIDGDGMWKTAKNKYSSIKKLEDDFVKSFMVNNRNSKNGLSGVAGNMAGIAQILQDQSVKGAVKSLALKFAGDIIGYNKTRAGAWEKLIRKLHLNSIENAKKAKNTIDDININSSSASSMKSGSDSVLSKGALEKELIPDIEKAVKTKSDADILTVSEKIIEKLGVGKEKLLTVANTVKEYIAKYGEELYGKMGELIDDIADKIGIRSKFIDDSKFKVEYGNGTAKELSTIKDIDELYSKMPKGIPEIIYEAKLLDFPDVKELYSMSNMEVAKKYGKEFLELKNKITDFGDDFVKFADNSDFDNFYKNVQKLEGFEKMSSKTFDKGGQKNIIPENINNNSGKMKNIKEADAKTIIDETIQNEGGTYDIVDGKIENKFGSDKISISLFPNRSKIITKDTLNEKEILDYIEANKDLLSRDDFTLGTWVNDKGDLYLDVATILPRNRKSEILKLGEKYNQEGVFDLKEGEFISTGGTGENIKINEADAIADIEKLLPKKDAGKQNVEFFTEKSAKASSDIPYEVNKELIKDVPEKLIKDFDKYTMGGNFTGHIAKMIPTFAEKQLRVTNAISKNAKSFLDIGASEGGVVKTVADNGVKRAVALDPNRQMFENFKKTPEVKNAEYELKAFGAEWVEDDGFKVLNYEPKEKFDAINEDFAFQFMHPDRAEQVKLAKSMLKDDGIFISQEKFNPEFEGDKTWLANEKKKYDHQEKYFNADQLTEDKQTIVSGMADDMVSVSEYEKVLKDNFKYVDQFWDAGNFKGFIASDSKKTFEKYLKDIGEITSEFDTRKSKKKIDIKEVIKQNPDRKNFTTSGEFFKLKDLMDDPDFDSADLYRAIGIRDWDKIPKKVKLYRGISENKDFDLRGGDFLTKNKKIAENFAGKNGKVKEFEVNTDDLAISNFGYEEVVYNPEK